MAGRTRPTEDEKIDEALEETFPASDPPAWSGGELFHGPAHDRPEEGSGLESSGQRAMRKSGGLHGKTFAILAADGVEQSELAEPRRALLEAGASVELVSLEKAPIRGWRRHDWGDRFEIELDLHAASPARYDGLVLPGGALAVDALRAAPRAITFVKDFFENGKPVAAICHAPWLLVEAGVLAGRRLTSWPSLKTDIRNAGGEWTDAAVVVDGTLLTARSPGDLPAFNTAMLGLFAEKKQRDSARTAIGPTDVP